MCVWVWVGWLDFLLPVGLGAVCAWLMHGGVLVVQVSANVASVIHDVWADNLEEEFVKIRELVEEHPYISMVRRACSAILASCAGCVWVGVCG